MLPHPFFIGDGMREITQKEKKKRGCVYCADVWSYSGQMRTIYCKYDRCPYRELDKCVNYEQECKKVFRSIRELLYVYDKRGVL